MQSSIQEELEITYSSENIYQEYLHETGLNTIKCGKIYSLFGIPFILALSIAEYLLFHNFIYIILNLIFIVPATFFLILSFTSFKNQPILAFPFHALTLAGTVLMVFGTILIRFGVKPLTPIVSITIASGLAAVVFLISFTSVGSRKYLPYIILPALAITFLIFNYQNHWSWFELLWFSNPLLIGLGCCIFAYYQEKSAFQDFLLKRQIETTISQLTKEMEEKRIIEAKLNHHVGRDELTNLYNRHKAIAILEKQMTLASRFHQSLTICFIDVDKLKKVNDTLGHSEGDLLLKRTANFLKENIRETDYICRIGGDEFLVIFPNCTHHMAQTIMSKVREKLIQTHDIDFSFGCSEFNHTNQVDIETFIEQADTEMYSQKVKKNKSQKKKPKSVEDNQQSLFN